MEKTLEQKLNYLKEEHYKEKNKEFDNSFEVGLYNGIEYALSILEEREGIYKILSSKKI